MPPCKLKRPFKGPRELLGGTEEKLIEEKNGSLICIGCGSMFFYKKETEKIELVARPVQYTTGGYFIHV